MEKAAITKPYTTVPGPDGSAEEHVLAVPLGENAFLVALERFLLERRRRRLMTITFGRSALPAKQQEMLRRAIRLEWITLGLPGRRDHPGRAGARQLPGHEGRLDRGPAVAGAADRLPGRRPHHPPAPRPAWPYGYHRSIGVGHLVAAVALLTMGTFLIIDSALGLLTAEHPTIGTVELFGQVFWLGWLMIAAMVVTGIPPVILGHLKMGWPVTCTTKCCTPTPT